MKIGRCSLDHEALEKELKDKGFPESTCPECGRFLRGMERLMANEAEHGSTPLEVEIPKDDDYQIRKRIETCEANIRMLSMRVGRLESRVYHDGDPEDQPGSVDLTNLKYAELVGRMLDLEQDLDRVYRKIRKLKKRVKG